MARRHFGSLRKLPSGRWQAGYWHDGQRYIAPETFRAKADAQAFLSVTETDIKRGSWIDPDAGKTTFSSFAEEWAAAQDWKATSRQSWDSVRARIIPLLGDLELAKIDLLKLQAIRRELSGHYATSTTTTTMSYVGSIMRAAYAGGRISRDPTRGFGFVKLIWPHRDGLIWPHRWARENGARRGWVGRRAWSFSRAGERRARR